MEQLLGPDHPQRARPHHLPHLLQQQVSGLVCCKIQRARGVKEKVMNYQSGFRNSNKIKTVRYQVISSISF